MDKNDCLKMLVEDIHSTTVATIGADGHPQTRTIDMMLWDEKGVYFLTAKGKAFYTQLMEQKYIALSATKDKKSVSLRGRIQNIGSEKLDEIFEKNPYMQKIYPGDTRSALEVFRLYEASGEYFDISDPSHVTRDSIVIGQPESVANGYFVGSACIGCKLCYSVCPQKCIDISVKPVVIDQSRCLHCGRCAETCPKQTIEKRGQP
ncbi:MAG: 4Fe-4S binding protein [Lachnospiraceae bacterium]|nr:4Fe-4S binding protein [Lachnospiraceae bacterium]